MNGFRLYIQSVIRCWYSKHSPELVLDQHATEDVAVEEPSADTEQEKRAGYFCPEWRGQTEHIFILEYWFIGLSQ